MTDHPRTDKWYAVPVMVATRDRARRCREEATTAGCTVLDFAATQVLSAAAADELVCNGSWTATTGESANVREVVVRAQRRRGLIP